MSKRLIWATEDIYESEDLWERDYKAVEKDADFSEFRGKLGDKAVFLSCMKKEEKLFRKIDTLYLYASMNHDADTRVSKYDALLSRITSLAARVGAETSFILPELTALPEEVLKGYIKDEDLKDYDYTLKCVLKEKAHVLSEGEEKLLAEGAETFSSFHDIFSKIDDADLPLGDITFNGEKTPLSHGLFGLIMHGEDRALRKKTFKQYYNSYISLINTISATYYGNVKKDCFKARVKKYSSALDMALSNEDVPVGVYKNLVSSVEKGIPYLHEYMRVKKKELGYRQFHMYDVYAGSTADAAIKLPYDKAYELVIKGLSVLGEEYAGLLKRAHDERWIDVEERKGKRSGAYSTGVFDSHPYVLLNYQETTHDVFTIAHEMGHSLHTYFSNKNQPYSKADYRIFVAEVASTVNEVLLIKYLLKSAEDVKLKKYLLSYLLEMIRTTLFRQTQFAEFEEFSHSSVENGVPLTKDNMCEKYLELNKKYYGKAVVSDDEIKYEWARIPHFYRAFYVYKYATGLTSALAIAERILSLGKPAVDDYFKFLSSGGSDSPVELLKIAGVDLNEKEPFERAMRVFKDTLDEYKSL